MMRKKFLTWCLVSLLILSIFVSFYTIRSEKEVGFDAVTFKEGDGTEDNPYLISNVHELQDIQEDLDAYYEIISEIDASETEEWNEGDGFDPIGGEQNEFNGSLEGKNYEIKDLFINRSEEHSVGLFGVIGDEGVVKNVSISDAEVVGNIFVGSLTGGNRGWVNNSIASGNVIGKEYVGGLVGGMVGDIDQSEAGNVKNIYANVNVTGYDNNTGGLIGQNRGVVINSHADGNVNGSKSVGGLVGSNYWGSKIERSYALGEVKGEEYVGGLVGFLGSHVLPGASISNSYSLGDVNGEVKVGGLVGYSNPYGDVDKSYSTGEVNGEEDVGGLIGDSDIPANIKNSFWDIETSQTNISDGGTGKTTEEMKDVATYTDTDTVGLENPWDFVGNPKDDEGDDQIWNIDDQQEVNYGYPFLNWQDIELTYDLTIDSTEGGEVIEPGEGIFTYDHGDILNLIAEPFEDHKFVEWSGDVENLEDVESEETTITLYNDYHITAKFEEIEDEKHILTIGVEGKGTTEPEPGEHEYEHEEEVKIEAIPEENWYFGDWSGDNQTIEDTKANETTIEMLDNYTITAQFSVNIYDLTIESTEGGEVEKPGEGTFQYEHGEEVNLTAVPDEGWYFEEWTGDYESENEKIIVTMNEDKEITAVFQKEEPKIPGFTTMLLLLASIIAVAIYRKIRMK